MSDYTADERMLCARHEATHAVFTVILGGWLNAVGIPKADGSPPKNSSIRGRRRGRPMGYANCNNINSGLNGFQALVGHAFEVANGDPNRALTDYQDAKELIPAEAFDDAVNLADVLVGQLAVLIDTVANQLMAKATKLGVIDGRKLDKIAESIQNELGDELDSICKQIRGCCAS
ncbi:MAG: hypothetical protein ACI82A_001268 [Candidatus Azotimanducaceae bacterium]